MKKYPMTHARVAAVLGDPAGIGPELNARLFADQATRSQAAVLLIADEAEVADGCRLAGMDFPFVRVSKPRLPEDAAPGVYLFHTRGGVDTPFERARATRAGGMYSLATLGLALELTARGHTDALFFGPLNKSSLHLGGMTTGDELHWFADLLGYRGAFCEFNVLDDLWTSRVTSHVALKDVSRLITEQGVLDAIALIDRALRQASVPEPRIAVCGLNPHNGDNGAFGREEIDIVAPAVQRARALGYPVVGPFPADTIFIKARERAFDAVVTMYHDQGQIAMKLMGFQRGVTVQGGLPVPVTTPAHGTAFDIYGQGRADVGASRQAFMLACRMGLTRRQTS